MPDRLKCLDAMDFVKDWGTWRSTLKDGIQKGKSMGMSDETIQKLAGAATFRHELCGTFEFLVPDLRGA